MLSLRERWERQDREMAEIRETIRVDKRMVVRIERNVAALNAVQADRRVGPPDSA